MKSHVKCVVAAVAALAVAAAAAHAAAVYSPLDQEILRTSIQGDRFEVIGGKLAEAKGASARTRALGHRLVSDHTKSLHEAVALAKRLSKALPDRPDTIPPAHLEAGVVGGYRP